VFVAGVGIVLGSAAARAVGVIFAGPSLIEGFFITPSYPWWAIIIIIIGVDALVIWALTVHWQEEPTGIGPPG
jgi:hypothetical protein